MSSEGLSTNFVCSTCGSFDASYFCLCRKPVLYLCSGCATAHREKSACKGHSLASRAKATEEVIASFSAERRASCFEQLRHVLRLNDLRLEDYRCYIDNLKATFLDEISVWYETALSVLFQHADTCTKYTEVISEILSRVEEGASPPLDLFEESLSNVSPMDVDSLCSVLTLFRFESVKVSLREKLTEIPTPSLTIPSSIGEKRIVLSYDNKTIPVSIQSEDTLQLIATIKSELGLTDTPTVTLEDGQTLNRTNCNVTTLRHGSVLQVDCDIRLKVTAETQEAEIQLSRKETVSTAKGMLSAMWKVDRKRLKLFYRGTELKDTDNFVSVPWSAQMMVECTVGNVAFLKPKLGLRRIEAAFAHSDTPLTLKSTLKMPVSTPLFYGASQLDDAKPLLSQGVCHMALLTYDLCTPQTTEIQVVLLSGKRKSVSFPHLHIQVKSLYDCLIELKAVLRTDRTPTFAVNGRPLQPEAYLDEAGVGSKAVLTMTKT